MKPILVVMGVSGSGKTAVGTILAERLGVPFVDGDDLHPPRNIAKMSAGQPLTDADRAPWLDRVADAIDRMRRTGAGGVIACSALKRAYRSRLAAPEVRLIYLQDDAETVRARLAHRRRHFMPASLVDSQFVALEPPSPDEDAMIVPPATTPEARAEAILNALQDDQA